MTPAHRLLLLAFALAGCDGGSSPDNRSTAAAAPGSATPAAFSPEERSLLAGGAKEADVRAARAFVAPFIRSDQSPCFADADLGGANMKGAADGGPALTRVAIAIDGSGSMAGRVGSRTKLELARAATMSFVDRLPAGVPASLTVFGQQGSNSAAGKARSCTGIDLLAPLSPDRAQLRAALGGVRAVGWTPLAAGLRAAQAQLGPSSVPGEQVVYVVSDGIETCGGDPVAIARDINRGRTRAIVNIIGFGLPQGEAAALQSVAGAGGGRFVNVTDDNGFDRALAEQMRLIDNRVAAGNARADNSIATGTGRTDATLCTGRLIAREQTDTLTAYDARAARGEQLPPRYQVVALMEEHKRLLADRRDAHLARLAAARDRANAAVVARENAAAR